MPVSATSLYDAEMSRDADCASESSAVVLSVGACAMAAEHIFTAPPHLFDTGPPVPCPGPYRQLSAAELATPVEGDSSLARNAAPDAAASADAGTSGIQLWR